MGRLAPEALFSNELLDLHHIRAVINDDSTLCPCDINDYDGVFERVAERARVIDPDGRKSYNLLMRMVRK